MTDNKYLNPPAQGRTSQDIIAAQHRAGSPPGPGLPARPGPPDGDGPPPVAAAALRAAARALQRALAQAEADTAAGGCAHAGESPAYRPPPREREHVIARDGTCRSPVCRQPNRTR